MRVSVKEQESALIEESGEMFVSSQSEQTRAETCTSNPKQTVPNLKESKVDPESYQKTINPLEKRQVHSARDLRASRDHEGLPLVEIVPMVDTKDFRRVFG